MSETPLPAFPDFCWPVDTSCVPDWNSASDDDDDVPRYTATEKARAISLAGQSMRLLTAFRVGGCPVTVRPAARRCQVQTWRTYPVSGAAPWSPVSVGGEWLNIGCGHDSCGCVGTREVKLYGAAPSSVSVVMVDGMELDPSAYRLDPGGLLVRLDGVGWPLCQDLTKADTEEGTWSVTYTPGAAVDGNGAWAAGVLAGEFVRACSTGECRLPDSVTQVVRSGITMTLAPGAFPGGLTGLREVDAYVQFWNPNGHTTPPVVWSPETRRPRRMAAVTSSTGIEDGGGPGDSGSVPDDGGTP